MARPAVLWARETSFACKLVCELERRRRLRAALSLQTGRKAEKHEGRRADTGGGGGQETGQADRWPLRTRWGRAKGFEPGAACAA